MCMIQDKKELNKKVGEIVDIIGNHRYDGAQIVKILIGYYELNQDALTFQHHNNTTTQDIYTKSSSGSIFDFLKKDNQ